MKHNYGMLYTLWHASYHQEFKTNGIPTTKTLKHTLRKHNQELTTSERY